jgi:hypothetical protein
MFEPETGAGDQVAVFRHEPDLLAGMEPAAAEQLRRHAVARTVRLEPGPWAPPTGSGQPSGCLGLLVLEGLLVRCVTFGGHRYPELIGSGDLLRPWDRPAETSSLVQEEAWRVVEPAVVAVLDGQFAAIVGRCPAVAAQLLARTTTRSRGLALSLAIVQSRHAETRLLALLWHLADRWGRMTPEGAVMPLRLTHQLLAELVCLRRPTASTALQRLRRAGRVTALHEGGWLLIGEPPGL